MGWGGHAVLGLQVAGLPLDVPGAVRRALHPRAPAAPTACCEDAEGFWAEGGEKIKKKGKGMRELGDESIEYVEKRGVTNVL